VATGALGPAQARARNATIADTTSRLFTVVCSVQGHRWPAGDHPHARLPASSVAHTLRARESTDLLDVLEVGDHVGIEGRRLGAFEGLGEGCRSSDGLGQAVR